jgi:hypothetical protein
MCIFGQDEDDEMDDGLEDWDPSRITRGIKVIEGYINALCSLHGYQQDVLGVVGQSYPRSPILKKFVRSIKKQKHTAKHLAKEDRGKRTIYLMFDVTFQ